MIHLLLSSLTWPAIRYTQGHLIVLQLSKPLLQSTQLVNSLYPKLRTIQITALERGTLEALGCHPTEGTDFPKTQNVKNHFTRESADRYVFQHGDGIFQLVDQSYISHRIRIPVKRTSFLNEPSHELLEMAHQRIDSRTITDAPFSYFCLPHIHCFTGLKIWDTDSDHYSQKSPQSLSPSRGIGRQILGFNKVCCRPYNAPQQRDSNDKAPSRPYRTLQQPVFQSSSQLAVLLCQGLSSRVHGRRRLAQGGFV